MYGAAAWFLITMILAVHFARKKQFATHRQFIYRHIASGNWHTYMYSFICMLYLFVDDDVQPAPPGIVHCLWQGCGWLCSDCGWRSSTPKMKLIKKQYSQMVRIDYTWYIFISDASIFFIIHHSLYYLYLFVFEHNIILEYPFAPSLSSLLGVVIGLCFTVVLAEVAIYATARVEEIEKKIKIEWHVWLDDTITTCTCDFNLFV